jgi:hypothetical protein
MRPVERLAEATNEFMSNVAPPRPGSSRRTGEAFDGAAPATTDRSARLALWVFVALVVAAVPLYLVLGRRQWFFLDDWDFLADRDAMSLHDLLRPHNEHWSTLPVLVYRALWRLVGLRHYWPYQIILVALHLTAAVLLRVIMRRASVAPWLATAAAGIFVLIGTGRDNILWSFQIGFTGALVCGLAHLILADHDGRFDRRDAAGIAFGAAGLMCSGIGVTMTFIVGLAVLTRRGWRMAALHTVPLAVCFGAWWLGFGRDNYDAGSASVGEVGDFVTTGIGNAFDEIGQFPGVGIALAVLLVAGLWVGWGRLPRERLRREVAAPGALLVGAFVFFVVSGFGRAGVARLGPETAVASRYVHLFAAMTLPAVAVAADAVIRRWRILTPLVVIVLLVGVPGNVAAIDDILPYATKNRQVLVLPRSPFAHEVPRSVRPLGIGGPQVTMAWLLDGVRSGRIPSPGRVAAAERAAASLSIGLAQRQVSSAPRGCTPLRKAVDVRLQPGDTIEFTGGPIDVRLRTNDRVEAPMRRFSPDDGQRIEALAGPLDLHLTPPLSRTQHTQLCR